MKTQNCIALSLGLVVTASLSAQVVFSDSLTTSSSSWVDSPPNQGGGALTFGASPAGLAFSVATPMNTTPFQDSAYKALAAYNAPSTSDWTAQVDINLAAFSGIMQNLFVNLNLVVGKTGDSTNNNTTFALDRYRNSSFVLVQDIDTYVTVGGSKTHLTEIVNSTTFATLKIGYDAATKVLTYSYDSDGPTSGWNFVTAHTADISGWSMGASDTFTFVLAGGSGSSINLGPTQSISASDAYFQNFSISAVPEPSTYAMLTGAAVLVLGVKRRWRRN